MSSNLKQFSAFFASGKVYSVDIKLHSWGKCLAKIEIEAETPQDLRAAWELQATAFITCVADEFDLPGNVMSVEGGALCSTDFALGVWVGMVRATIVDSFYDLSIEDEVIGRIAACCNYINRFNR